MFSFFFWYFPFILLDFPVNSDVFFTFVLVFLAVPCVSYFFGFCSFHFATFFVTTNVSVFCFRCFLVIFLHSRVFSSFQTCSLPFLGRPYVSFLCVFHFWHLYSHFARSSSGGGSKKIIRGSKKIIPRGSKKYYEAQKK